MKERLFCLTSSPRKSINKTNVITYVDDVLLFVETSYNHPHTQKLSKEYKILRSKDLTK